MIKWRCLNDIMGYCKGDPKWEVKPHAVDAPFQQGVDLVGGHCGLNPYSCGRYQTASEHYAGVKAPGTGYRHTVVAKKKAKEGGK